MEAVNPVLQSAIVDKYGQPFAQKTQKIVEQLDVTVEKQEIVIEKQDEIGKATKKVMRNFEFDMGGAFARSSDGIKELTGGFLDIKDIIETVGKKFSALGDVIAPFSEMISGFGSALNIKDRFKKDKKDKTSNELPAYLQEDFVGPVTKKQLAEQKKQRKRENISRIFGKLKFAAFVAAGIGIFFLLKKFIQSGFFAGLQDLAYKLATAFDKTLMVFVNEDKKKMIRKRMNERDIDRAETLFNRNRTEGPTLNKRIASAKNDKERSVLLGNLFTQVGIPTVDGIPTKEGEQILGYVAEKYDLDKNALLKQYGVEKKAFEDKLEAGEVKTQTVITGEDDKKVFAKVENIDTKTDALIDGIAANSQTVSTGKKKYDFKNTKMITTMGGYGMTYIPEVEKTEDEIKADLDKAAAKKNQKLLEDGLLTKYTELRAFASANGLGYVLDMMEGEHVKGGKTIAANAYFGPDGVRDKQDTLELMNAPFLQGKSLAELQTLLGNKKSIADSNIEAKEKAYGDQLKQMQDNALLYGASGMGMMSMPITNISNSSIQNLTGSQNSTNDEGLNSSN